MRASPEKSILLVEFSHKRATIYGSSLRGGISKVAPSGAAPIVMTSAGNSRRLRIPAPDRTGDGVRRSRRVRHNRRRLVGPSSRDRRALLYKSWRREQR